jgi:hypothetical protein
MSISKIFAILSLILLSSCNAVHEESTLEAVAAPNVTGLMSCNTGGGWLLTLAKSDNQMFLVYKKNMSFGFETVEGKQKEVLSPVSKFIQVGLIESSKVAAQSIFLKIKLPAKKESSPALNSQEPSDAEFSKIEAFVESQSSMEIDYKEPHSSGKIGFRGNASSKGFESPFLVCSGPAKIEQNKLEK